MKKRHGILLVLLMVLGFCAPVALASFVIKADEGNYIIDESGSLADPENVIQLDYNDGVSGTTPYPYSESIDVSSLPKPSGGLSNHVFDGWYLTKTGMDDTGSSTEITGTFSPTVGQTIYARYTNDAGILSTMTSGIAINKNSPGDSSNIYYFGASDGSGEMYINSGGYVQVYYGTSSVWDDGDYGSDNSMKFLSEADVVVKLDCDVIINGGFFQINGVFGKAGVGIGNALSGSFTALDLNGYTITVRNGGYLNGYGIIYNSQETGGIAIEDGYITTCFSPMDYAGGGNFLVSYGSTTMPFLGYCAPYLCCEVIVSSLGEVRGFTSLYANYTKYSTNFCLINNPNSTGDNTNALLTLTNGYIIKNTTSYDKWVAAVVDQYNYNDKAYQTGDVEKFLFDPNVYREELIFTDDPNGKLKHLDVEYPKTYQCIAEFRALTMTVMSQEGSMRYGTFPIPSFFDVEAYNTKLSFAIDLAVMPGANIYIDESSTVNMATRTSSDGSYYIFSRITIMDRYPADLQFVYNSSTKSDLRAGKGSYFTGGLLGIKNPPKVQMNGKFTFDTSVSIDFSSSYNYWYSIGGGMNLSEQALESLQQYSGSIELASRAYIPYLYGWKKYDLAVAQWFNQPIIGDERAYFQPGGKGTEIVVCEDFDEENGLVKYKGNWYFYKFTKESGYSGIHDSSLFGYASSPVKSDYVNKFADTAGTFTKLDEAPTTIKGNQGEAVYIKYNGVYRINVMGAFIELASGEKPYIDEYGAIAHVTTASATSSKLRDTANKSYSTTLSTDAYFEPSTQHWRVAYAS